jgi:hypothetical protein
MMLINSSLDEKIAGSGANGAKQKTKASDKLQEIQSKVQKESKNDPLIATKLAEAIPGTGEVSEVNANGLER